ncbi:MAG TPA: cytochrome c oxidase subunit II [Actinomycetota bacterium]|jgi:cytochrome c oxidase subunit 2|nr:cytochrome c oxidase subunit II [Actinomycetota bacterium]
MKRRIGWIALAVLGTACTSGSPSVLDPKGRSAERVEGLWWLMLWISVAVLAVVVGMMAVAIARRRTREAEPRRDPPRWGGPFVAIAGVFVPVLVLTGVYVLSLRQLQAITRDDATLEIDVIGHVWWWEARYPNGAVTANEIHLPVGEPVRIRLSTADVIHSFWVPQLGPKIDMIPGRTNQLVLEATEPGRYRGQCAEFCGLQHANMAFFVVAEPRVDFETWAADMAAPARSPSTVEERRGLQVFLGSTCVGCHTIRGTEATAELGPDLTHLATRETIAAGTLPLTERALARWITAPQDVKPGAVMPPTELTPEELDVLVTYLRSLR